MAAAGAAEIDCAYDGKQQNQPASGATDATQDALSSTPVQNLVGINSVVDLRLAWTHKQLATAFHETAVLLWVLTYQIHVPSRTAD